MTTKTVETRDWEALRRDIIALGKVAAAQKHGYKSGDSAVASLATHDSRRRARSAASSRLAKKIELPTHLPIIKGEDGKIPEEIEKQLLSTEMLPVDSLIVDKAAYQREEDTGRIQKMTREWNWLACGTLAVSLRKGEKSSYYAVVDGQQRLSALRIMGYKEAPCRVYIDLTPEQEAELFELLNRNKKPGYNDLFRSRLYRGEQIAKNINTAVEIAGYHLDPERKHSGKESKDSHFYIQTMAEMERMYNTGGSLHIMDTLKLVKEVFAPEHLGEQQLILAGFSQFIRDYPDADRRELINKVKRTGQLKLVQQVYQYAAVHGTGRSGGGSGRGINFSETLLIIYNSNRQETNRIPSKRR